MITNKNEIISKFNNILESKVPGSTLLFLVLRGSHAYGTNTETSDEDYFGVYVQNQDGILGFNYVDQINEDNNDTSIVEIRKFLDLLSTANPSMLEMLNTPVNCILYKHDAFDLVINNKDIFVTKQCAKTFAGYATQQIKKAKGTDKKQNWEMDRVTRKTPLDFCFLHIKEKSVPLEYFLKKEKLSQLFCGLSKVPHSRETYALFYDYKADILFKQIVNYPFLKKIYKFFNRTPLQGFKGISFETSNDIRLSSIPINSPKRYFLGYVSFNKDGYVTHCDDYRSYENWLKNRNEQRFVDVKSHDQKIDGKNMLHCRRLLEMAKEISEGKGINVRRKNAEYLISIRKGEVDLQTLIDNADRDIKQISENFVQSTLPDSVDKNIVNNILIDIRKIIYN
jgi:hypothetical protein